ncbi:hypothetical protein C8J31_1057 [Rhizobium sp. PP-CC-2G-626]|nr:hypothetical protein C8J31_1057 [Rhizobium sp. PP-CC-2G-626]
MARSTGDSSFGSKDSHIGHAVLLILRGETEPNDPYFFTGTVASSVGRKSSRALMPGTYDRGVASLLKLDLIKRASWVWVWMNQRLLKLLCC